MVTMTKSDSISSDKSLFDCGNVAVAIAAPCVLIKSMKFSRHSMFGISRELCFVSGFGDGIDGTEGSALSDTMTRGILRGDSSRAFGSGPASVGVSVGVSETVTKVSDIL